MYNAYYMFFDTGKMDIEPIRVYSGTLMTSLNSAGVHVSLLKLIESHRDIFVKCLDEETMAPCWPGGNYSIPSNFTHQASKNNDEKKTIEKVGISLNIQEQDMMKLSLENACTAIIEKEAYLNELDRGCGDGDCGSTLKRLADSTQCYICNYHLYYIYFFTIFLP